MFNDQMRRDFVRFEIRAWGYLWLFYVEGIKKGSDCKWNKE